MEIKPSGIKVFTLQEWYAEADRLFGQNSSGKIWQFVCPKCKTVQTAQDFIDGGVSEELSQRVTGFSCIGRYVKGKGCDWTLGGLFQIHRVEVKTQDGRSQPMFEFYDPATASTQAEQPAKSKKGKKVKAQG